LFGSAPRPDLFLHAAQVTLDVDVGFHGVFQLGRPFPVRVQVENFGPPREGVVEAEIWRGGLTKGIRPYRLIHRRPLFLPARGAKSVGFTVDPDSIGRPLKVRFSGPDFNFSREIDLRRHFSPKPLILLLSAQGSGSLPAQAFPREQPLVEVGARELPTEAGAYRGVSAVVFYEPSLRDLSEGQIAALEDWLSSGGTLLVLGSLRAALYQEPRLTRFMPVKVGAAKRMATLSSLEPFAPGIGALGGVWLLESAPVQGRTRAAEQGTPLWVEMDKGRGRVSYLALDIGRPPLAQWRGLERLLFSLLPPRQDSPPAYPTHWNEAVFSQVLSTPFFIGSYIPLRPILFWFVGYGGGLALLVRLYRRRSLTAQEAVLWLVALGLGASTGGYLHLTHGGHIPDGVLFSAQLYEGVADGYVDVQSNVAVFSTRRRPYGLKIEQGGSQLEPAGAAGNDELIYEDRGANKGFVVPVREWDYRLFRFTSSGYLPVSLEVEDGAQGLGVKITNASVHDLLDCWLWFGGERVDLGNLPRGATRSVKVPAGGAQKPGAESATGRPIAARQVRFHDRVRDVLFHQSLFTREHETVMGSQALVFFGWVVDPPRHVWLEEPRVAEHHYALYRAVLPLGSATEE
jgi:hypothetical protein